MTPNFSTNFCFRANKDHVKLSIEIVLNQFYAYLEYLIVCYGELSTLPITNGFDYHRIRIITCADDVSAMDRIETQLHYLSKGKKMVSSSCIEIDSQGREINNSKRFLFHNQF